MLVRRTFAAATTLAVGLATCAVGFLAGAEPSQAAATRTVTLRFAGGHDTDPVDNGRPVVLVAAGLGVPTAVFRDAFSRVHPADAGRQPTDEQARANKAALLSVLAPYGVTNERLDEVSNRYRYNRSAGQTWTRRGARATAVIRGDKVVSVKLLDGGMGYSSTPTVTVPGVAGARVTATVSYGTDLTANGAVTALKLG